MSPIISELARARKALRLSKTEVARRMGVPRSTVCRIEAGSRAVLLPTLEAYAAALGKRLAIEEA